MYRRSMRNISNQGHDAVFLENKLKITYLSTLLFFGILFKFFITQGSDFNQSLHDDENDWLAAVKSQPNLGYILQRDIPGYFVIVPRTFLLIVEILNLDPIVTTRVFIPVLQATALLAFSYVVIGCAMPSLTTLYLSLLTVPIEDLNYLHNIGYIFLFFVITLWILAERNDKKFIKLQLGLIGGLITCKPLVALIILLILMIEKILHLLYKKKSKNIVFENTLFAYMFIYLTLYFLLPTDFISPEKISIESIGKSIFNLPWILGTAMFPILNIGFIGLIRINFGAELANHFGFFLFSIYAATLAYIVRRLVVNRHQIQSYFPEMSQKQLRIIVLATVFCYLSVFSVSNFAWVSEWPLWELAYSPRIWMRWASDFPILAISLTALMFIKLNKHREFFLATSFVLIQNVLLWVFAHEYLLRWNG
jgi:hypothetical protein